MTDLAQLINDTEAANRCRVEIGLPLSEEYGAEGAHPRRTPTCTIIGSLGSTGNSTKVIYWLEDNAERYGYKVTGSYVDFAILEAI
jgi:hypothetical protein